VCSSDLLELYTGLAMILALVFLPGGITGFGLVLYRRIRARIPMKGASR